MSSLTLDDSAADTPTTPSAPAPEPRRFWSRSRVVIAAAVVLALSAGGTLFAAHSARAAAAERDRVAALEQAQARFAEASNGLATALDAAADALATTAPGVTAEQVTDVATVEALQQAHGELVDLVDAPPAAWSADTASWDTEALNASVQDLLAHTTALSTATANATAAAQAVHASHDAWVLDRATTGWTDARTQLAAALDAARALLDSTGGKVVDDQTRVNLSATIDAAQAAHDGHVDDHDAVALDAAAVDISALVLELQAASEPVSASHTQWQASQRTRTSAQSTAGNSSTGNKAGAAPKRQSNGGGGAGATGHGGGTSNVGPKAPPAEDNRTAGDILGGSNCFATSSNGDTWTC